MAAPDEESASVHKPPPGTASRRVIEEEIRTIEGVVNCRVVWDREGRISEIHVVASGERPAKMVARDVQSLLLVNHDLQVPYQKISVVIIAQPVRRAAPARPSSHRLTDVEVAAPPAEGAAGRPVPGPEGSAGPPAPPPAAGTAGPAAAWPSLPPAGERGKPEAGALSWSLDGLFLRLLEGQLEVTAYVTGPSGERSSGQCVGPAGDEESAALGARAVLAALAGEGPAGGAAVAWVDLAGPVSGPVVVVGVKRTFAGAQPGVRWGVGSAPLRGNAVLAGALAALEALGKLSPERTAGL